MAQAVLPAAPAVVPAFPNYDHEMTVTPDRRVLWWTILAAIIIIGIASRVSHTGIRLVDKYLGDALYAAMVYVIFRLTGRISRVAVWTAVTMTAIEFFQATGIPASMLHSDHLVVRVVARLIGTEFSVRDLAAYAVGIGCLAALDHAMGTKRRDPTENIPR